VTDLVDLDANDGRPGGHSRDVCATGVSQAALGIFFFGFRFAMAQQIQATAGFHVRHWVQSFFVIWQFHIRSGNHSTRSWPMLTLMR